MLPHPWGSALPPPPPTVCEFISGCRAVRYRDARARRSGPNRIQFVLRRLINCGRTRVWPPPRPTVRARMIDRKSSGDPSVFYAVRRWNNRKNRTTRTPTRRSRIPVSVLEKTKSAITRNRFIRNWLPGVFNSDWPLDLLPKSCAPSSDRYEKRKYNVWFYIFLRLNSIYGLARPVHAFRRVEAVLQIV